MSDTVPARGNILGKCVPARYILAILGSIGMAIVYGLKICLSVTMIAMLNHTAIALEQTEHGGEIAIQDGDESCEASFTTNDKPEDGPFNWSEPLQGTILSCYFWGYLVSQIPGAMVAERFSAKWVMFFSVAINIVCTLLTPIMTKIHYGGLILMRVLEGIGGGATFPAMHCMIAAWAPPNERSVMSTIIYVGTAFGTAKSILMAGILASKFGWESVFYIMGGLSCIWIILWLILVQDNPNKQPLISLQEREFITSELGTSKPESKAVEKKKSTPWKKVLTSVPFWAILIAHSCSNWGWYMFLIEIPFYVKQVLQFNVSSNALVSALPYYPLLILSIVLSKTMDALRSRGKITTTTARKTATIIASLIPLVCLLILCFIGCHETIAIVVMSIGITAMGAMFCGFLTNHIDIAPNYAGTLVALTNTVATIPGVIVPLFVGFMTKGNQTIGAWRVIFFVTIALFLIELVVFTIFGSGKEQKWNKSNDSSGDEETPLKQK